MCLVCRGRGGRKEGREEWEGGEGKEREERRGREGSRGKGRKERNQLKANLRQCAIWHSEEESEFPYEEVKGN